MEMSSFTSRTPGAHNSQLEVIPNYGRTESGLTLLPIAAGSQTLSTAPSASYTFYTTSNAANAKVTMYLPPSFNTDPGAPLAYAIAIDDGTPTSVKPVPNSTLGTMPTSWSESVVNGARKMTTTVGKVGPGVHVLRVWLLEPGTVVHRMVVDLGGVRDSYLGPPESVKVGF
jgi:hypothetical protein